MTFLRFGLTVVTMSSFIHTNARAQSVPYGTGNWNADSLGNHRAVIRVDAPAGAVAIRIPWRRRDASPGDKHLIVQDAATNGRVANVLRVDINREFGDVIFEPTSGVGEYHVYYMPYVLGGRANYPTTEYPAPNPTAAEGWVAEYGLTDPAAAWATLPGADFVELQSIDDLNSFYPMELIATGEEVRRLLDKHLGASFLLFPETRRYPIRMPGDLPLRWIEAGAEAEFRDTAGRGEFFAFQIGVYAVQALTAVSVQWEDFVSPDGIAVPASEVQTFNFGGTDWVGARFEKRVSVAAGTVQPLWFGLQIPEEAAGTEYRSRVTVSATGTESRTVGVRIAVDPTPIANHGDDEPWRHARLRWLNSTIALDDDLVHPFTAVEVDGRHLRILGRSVELDPFGFPASIDSYFTHEMTGLHDQPRELLTGPMRMVVESSGATAIVSPAGWQFDQQEAGIVRWSGTNVAGPLRMAVRGSLEFDGTMEYEIEMVAEDAVAVEDIRLEIPLASDVAKYMLGMGRKGGYRPDQFEWSWEQQHNQDGAWLGDVNAGLQFSLRDDRYERPLNTNFYLRKPLVMPASWDNGGLGGCSLRDDGEGTYWVRCHSGARSMVQGEPLRYDFRLAITPFRTLDTDAQWQTRFFHRFNSLDSIAALGANTVNVHHATPVNPYINYPFLSVEDLRDYVHAGHERDMRIKIYYTVRELTNRAPEIFALKSLGDEVFSYGSGGGPPWLREHLDDNYLGGWYVPRLKDAAVVNSGVSRWHNFYLEGLNWLVRNVGIDGIYIDDVAFDRTVMKRLRKILDRNKAGALIDLHSANQFNERDGFANSANLYMEHFPYIDRLWFGEYFDYDSPPEFWMTEVAGIPFGLMGEMLQDGGNQWRGMLYGMTSRLPWAGDPTPLWKAWDEFGMVGSRMIGYWVPDAPVATRRDDVLVTTYLQPGRAMIAIASWAADTVNLELDVDWSTLGLDPATTVLQAPTIAGFQAQATFRPGDPIPVPPGRGWLLTAAPMR